MTAGEPGELFGVEVLITSWSDFQEYSTEKGLSRALLLEGRLVGSGIPGINKDTPHTFSIRADSSLENVANKGTILSLPGQARVDFTISVSEALFLGLYASLSNASLTGAKAKLDLLVGSFDAGGLSQRHIAVFNTVELLKLNVQYELSRGEGSS